jgi:hypothetical protein
MFTYYYLRSEARTKACETQIIESLALKSWFGVTTDKEIALTTG